eukprot:jgi/Picre1/31084/NNA_006439.t1
MSGKTTSQRNCGILKHARHSLFSNVPASYHKSKGVASCRRALSFVLAAAAEDVHSAAVTGDENDNGMGVYGRQLTQDEILANWTDRFGDEPRKGSDVLVQCWRGREHEQGEIFAAEGYAKVTGKVGVCIATSGPGATNLVTGLADALLDSVPLVAITGQVPRKLIGTDGFQETPIVEVTRQITKHNYLVMNVEDIPRIMKEAFYLARSGRPGPVLVDIPKDVQQTLCLPNWDDPVNLRGYISRLPMPAKEDELEAVVEAIKESKRPMLYVGGGCVDAYPELAEFVKKTGIPVAQTLMGLGAFPEQDPMALQMLGMHGTVAANYAIHESDLLLAIGVRFDDRVTGKLEEFAARARIVHIDIDPAEINKNKHANIAICSDSRSALRGMNNLLDANPLKDDAFGNGLLKWMP